VGAARGLVARGGLGVGAGRRGGPALQGGPAEAVSVQAQAQGRGRREADDRRGDLAPPAVGPAAILGLLVQAAAAGWTDRQTDRPTDGLIDRQMDRCIDDESIRQLDVLMDCE